MIAKELLIQPSTLQAVRGEMSSAAYFIVTDSRKVSSRTVFVALKGDKFDGHDFIPEILEKNFESLVFVCDEQAVSKSMLEEWSLRFPMHVFVTVSDCYRYLSELAKACRVDWKRRVPSAVLVGITGSNGKTTTKEMVSHILKTLCGEGNVLGTKGNLNNHIGVPLTLFELTDQQFAIVEMGTNHPGEIQALVAIADPDVGVVTSVGKSHLEFFHTVENVFIEKRTLLDHVLHKESGYVVLNNDDFHLATVKTHSFQAAKFSEVLREDLIHVHYAVHSVLISLEGKTFEISNNALLGKHNFVNATAAFLICRKLLGGREDEVAMALSTFTPSSNRSQWLEINGKRIFSDAYNANPSSMESSLQAFSSYVEENRLLPATVQVIMADMNELGETAIEEHRLLGSIAKKFGVKAPIFIGRYSKEYQTGFDGPCHVYSSTSEFLEQGKAHLEDKKYLFLKGSRTLQLERILDITV